MEENFKKYHMVEMSAEDAELWRWVCFNKQLFFLIYKEKKKKIDFYLRDDGNADIKSLGIYRKPYGDI